jgi:hypothetical protein
MNDDEIIVFFIILNLSIKFLFFFFIFVLILSKIYNDTRMFDVYQIIENTKIISKFCLCFVNKKMNKQKKTRSNI